MTHSYVRYVHSYVWRDSSTCVTGRSHMYYRAQCEWYVWHDSLPCVTWLVHMCDISHSYVWHDSFIRVTWLIHRCDVTHPYVRQDSQANSTRQHNHIQPHTHLSYNHSNLGPYTITLNPNLLVCHPHTQSRSTLHNRVRQTLIVRVNPTHSHTEPYSNCVSTPHTITLNPTPLLSPLPCLVHVRDMPGSYVRHASFTCDTCLLHVCDITHTRVRHDSFTRQTLHVAFISGTCLVHICDVFFMRATCFVHMCNMPRSCVQHMGWLRLVNSLKS